MLVGVSDNDKYVTVCAGDTMVSVCMSRWVCVCVSFLLLCFKLSYNKLRVFVYPTSRQSRWFPEGYPTSQWSHSLRDPHCWRVFQETHKCQSQWWRVWHIPEFLNGRPILAWLKVCMLTLIIKDVSVLYFLLIYNGTKLSLFLDLGIVTWRLGIIGYSVCFLNIGEEW